MRQTGKLDYLELPATGATFDHMKAFYATAFSWTFTDYGPTYSAFDEGLEGGFQADSGEVSAKPLPVLFSEDLEGTLAAVDSMQRLMQAGRFRAPRSAFQDSTVSR